MAKLSKPHDKPADSSPTLEQRRHVSEMMLKSSMTAAASIRHLYRHIDFRNGDDGETVRGLDSITLLQELNSQAKSLRSGDLQQLEDLLLAQAQTLNAVFHRYLHRMDSAEYLPQAETYAHIALKAQHQSRQTIATLGELKHPRRTTFIKQQNNAVNQQINQSGGQGDKPAQKSENFSQSENELLDQDNGKRLDSGTTQAPSRTNPALAAVGKIYRSED